MITTAMINPAELVLNWSGLLADNWTETGFDFPFAPDADMYQRMFDAGVIFAIAALKDEAVIGYCVIFVAPHPHNPAVVVASNDVIFVARPYRNGIATARLMHAAEAEAKRRGAMRFTWHCRAGTEFAEMLSRHGYTPVDHVVMKGL